MLLAVALGVSLTQQVSAAEQFNNSVIELAKFNGPVQTIVELPNGQIMVGGDFTKVNNTVKLGIARLNSDGSVDSTFTAQVPGPDIPGTLDVDTRKFTIDKSPTSNQMPNYFTRVWGIIPDADGYLVVADNANYYNYAFGYLRLNQDGSTDKLYRSKYSANLGFAPIRIARLPSGKILLGGLGGADNGIRVAVLDKNGDFDTSFAPNPSVPRDNNGGFLGMGYLADESVLVITGQPKTGVIGDPNNPCIAVLKYTRTGTQDFAWEKKFASHSITGLNRTGGTSEVSYVGRANSLAQLPDGKVLISVGFASKPTNIPQKGQETCYGGSGSFVLIDKNGDIDQDFKDTTLSPQTTFSATYEKENYLIQSLVSFSASGGPTLVDKSGNIDSRLKVDAKMFYDESFFQSAGVFSSIGRYTLVSGNATNNLLSGFQENYVLRKIWLNPESPTITNFSCIKLKCSISISASAQNVGGFMQDYEIDIKSGLSVTTHKINGGTVDLPPRKPNELLDITARAISSSGKSFDSKAISYLVPQFVPQSPVIKVSESATNAKLTVTTNDDGGSPPFTVIVARVNPDGSYEKISEFGYLTSIAIQKESKDYEIRSKVLNAVGESDWSEPVLVRAAVTKKSTIVCIKGKLTKKVTAVKPKCPSGYKVKK
jgi:uncharacterized delta-60 repeat protein